MSFLLILRPLVLYRIQQKILIRWWISTGVHWWISLKNMHLLGQSRCHRELCSPGITKRYKVQKDREDTMNTCGLELACLFTMKCLSWLDCMLETSLPLSSLTTITIRSMNARVTRKLFLAWLTTYCTNIKQLTQQLLTVPKTISSMSLYPPAHQWISTAYNCFCHKEHLLQLSMPLLHHA